MVGTVCDNAQKFLFCGLKHLPLLDRILRCEELVSKDEVLVFEGLKDDVKGFTL